MPILIFNLHVLIHFFSDINHPPQFINLPHEIIVPENKHGRVLTIQSHDQDVDDNVIITWFWKDIYAVKFFTFRYESKNNHNAVSICWD